MDVAFEKVPNELRDQIATRIRERRVFQRSFL
jgi:hypothetical protein